MDPLQLFNRITDATASPECRKEDLQVLEALVKSGEVRDTPFTTDFYSGLFRLIVASFKWGTDEGAQGDTQAAQRVFLGIIRTPEFDAVIADKEMDEELIWRLAGRIEGGSPVKDQWPFIRQALVWLYSSFVTRRSQVRSLLGRSLRSTNIHLIRSVPVAPLLGALAPIIRGFRTPLSKVHRAMLTDLLLPLHKPNTWEQWDRQTPMIGMYHKELVLCIETLLEKQPSLTSSSIQALCTCFPPPHESNTPKEVLLVFEIGRLIRFLDADGFRQSLQYFLSHMVRLLGSQNAMPIQAVLQLWKDERFVELCNGASAELMPALLPALLRGGELFWNPTVNRMTSLVLEKLEASNPTAFAAGAERLWGPNAQVPHYELADAAAAAAAEQDKKAAKEAEEAAASSRASAPAPNISSLNFLWGGWTPPSGGAGGTSSSGSGGCGGGGGSKQPPVTITGVAPWAVGAGSGGARGSAGPLRSAGPLGGAQAFAGTGKQPPLTTTGVAPWAFPQKRPPIGGGGASAGAGRGRVGLPPANGARPQLSRPSQDEEPLSFAEEDEEDEEEGVEETKPQNHDEAQVSEEEDAPAVPTSRAAAIGRSANDPAHEATSDSTVAIRSVGKGGGLERVREYIHRLCPGGSASTQTAPAWEAALTAETPTLLPTLKFHQLVFGNEALGTGAFSVVQYARAVDKEKTQSQWAEYAVKVINTQTMVELGYEACVNREICVLRMLSHPGIARMVSSFRWRDGAYLVLEYAKRGDLHTILAQLGKLEEEHARFFSGEVIAALNAIHDLGFVYGDLKPENIVITATGHAKLTDFGGCRPLTEEARERTRQSLLRGLRDGDWRAEDDEEVASMFTEEQAAELIAADGTRVEGTTMYLPPEVVRGSVPTQAADAWALGCVVYQMLSGRPPIWAESELEEDLRSRIVSFRLDNRLHDLPEKARGLVTALMEADAEKRRPVSETTSDPWFEGLDILTLYRKPRGPDLPATSTAAAIAAAEGATDERWQKRQHSKIWNILPSAQDFMPPPMPGRSGAGDIGGSIVVIEETDLEAASPFVDGCSGGSSLPVRTVQSL
eukprot:TRINITY_DN37277_c0_g1_i1.p1 TRINITY_DN37277_c0_g1~~TRINITY_DN37277_c0_g1_i1.p1  ORF type:complete len:1069 (-),score=233.90 TRINITY_DN37277_c0_g1_i1:64-3270(-)